MRRAIVRKREDDSILPDVPSLVISEQSKCNVAKTPFAISSFTQLRELIICDRNYVGDNECSITNNANLHSIIVKNQCFFEEVDNEESTGSLCISNCPSLRVIEIGDSFCNFRAFRLEGMGVEHL